MNRSLNIISIIALLSAFFSTACLCDEIKIASSSEVIGQNLPQINQEPEQKIINGVPVDYLISEIDKALDDQQLAVVVDTEIGTQKDSETDTDSKEKQQEKPRELKRGRRPAKKPDAELQPVNIQEPKSDESKADKTEIEIIKVTPEIDDDKSETPNQKSEQPVNAKPELEKNPTEDKKVETVAPMKKKTENSQQIPNKKYLVRSSPILTESDTKDRINLLESKGYHPIAREETVGENEKYYVLDMGRFDKLDLAINMLEKIRDFDPDFFIVGTRFVRSEYKGLFSQHEMNTMFPHKSGEGGEDSLALLTGQAAGPKTGAAFVKMEGNEQEKLIVRKNITGEEQGLESTDNNLRLIARTSEQGNKKENEEKTQLDNTTGKENNPVKQRMLVHEKLQEMAWDMRAQGLSVYLENESFEGPEGTLAGMFDDRESALELGEELRGYGYAVNVIRETGINDLYYVYADPDNTTREIMVITPQDFQQFEKKNGFNPPPNPALDTLLGLIQTSK